MAAAVSKVAANHVHLTLFRFEIYPLLYPPPATIFLLNPVLQNLTFRKSNSSLMF